MKRETKRSILELALATALGIGGIAGISGCNNISRDLNRTEDRITEPKTQSAKEYIKQEIISLEKNHRLVDMYNSIDVSQASDEEREWLADTDKKKLVLEMRKDLAKKTVKTIDNVCGLDDISDKDGLFIYRIFNPIINQIYERSDMFEMQR